MIGSLDAPLSVGWTALPLVLKLNGVNRTMASLTNDFPLLTTNSLSDGVGAR